MTRLRIWHTFCEQTPLQGFLILRNSNLRFKTAMWLMLIATAIGLTIRDSIKTVRDYVEEGTLSKVSMELNKSIILPNPTICIGINFTNISSKASTFDFTIAEANEAQVFLQHNKDKILYYFKSLPAILDSLPISYKSEQMYNEYLQSEAEILVRIVYLTQLLVESIRESDANQVFPINKSSEINTPIVKQPYQYLNDFFNENNINLAEALKTVGMYTCIITALYPHRLYMFNDLWASWCRSRYVTYLGIQEVCVRGSQSETKLFNFTATGKFVIFSWLSKTPLIEVLYIDVNFDRPERRNEVGAENQLSSINARRTEVEVISTKAYPTRKFPCGNDMDFTDCRTRCIEDLVHTKCGCMKLSAYYLYCLENVCNDTVCLSGVTFNQNSSGLFIQQFNCKAELYNNGDLKTECEQKCPKPCLRLHLQFSEINVYNNLVENELQFQMSKFAYLNIEQALAMDTQTLMANLGGNLGLYIGGTFLALFHLITSLIHLVVSLIRAKEEAEPDPIQLVEFRDCSIKMEIDNLKETVAQVKVENHQLKKEIEQLREDFKRISNQQQTNK